MSIPTLSLQSLRRSLSARLLLLTIIFVMIGEVLIYVPSVARFRISYLEDRIAAARLAAELEPFGTVANFEDPVLKDNLDWFRLLREKTWIPIALHLGAPAGVLAALKAEAVDYINLGGSALQVRQSAALAEAANVPVWVQMGGLCLGVKAAYSVHLQSTLANATLACDELPFTRIADVCDGSLQVEAGHFLVPEGPGLGIHVDLDVVEKYRVA